jgi:hypothetical protein
MIVQRRCRQNTNNIKDMKTRLENIRELIVALPSAMLFQSILAVAFAVPLVATLGQFGYSGFLWGRSSFLVAFWPGVEWKWAPSMPVWLTMGAMGISYVVGIAYLVHQKTFGKVVLWSIAALVVANAFGSAVNHLTGWKELQSVSSMSLAGRVNGVILASWQNPLWEEVVFRGLPLLVLLSFWRGGVGVPNWARWIYIVVPNIIFAIYHVPGHGPSRLADTVVLGCAFSWMTLRYSFFAPLIMHYVLDAMIVISLSKFPNIPADEVPWLVHNTGLLNSSWSLTLLAAILSLPLILAWNAYRRKKDRVAATT